MLQTSSRKASPKPSTPKRAGTSKAKPIAVDRKQTTVRLSQSVQVGLALVQKTLGGTVNQHMNAGLSKYIDEALAAVDQDLSESLARIRRFRQKDPAYTKTFEQVAADEAKAAHGDPTEGVAFREDMGPAHKKVRELIAGRTRRK
jgi:hypothetical protein